MLTIYQWIAHVIQKALAGILEKIKNDISLTLADQVRNYEICYTFFLMCRQLNYFKFSEYYVTKDIVYIYRQKELQISWNESHNKEKETPNRK